MGRTITPTYRVEFKDNTSGKYWNSQSWESKAYGQPTDTNLESWRQRYNKSFGIEGVNFHCSRSVGFIIHIHTARLIRQATGEIIATTTMPAFESM